MSQPQALRHPVGELVARYRAVFAAAWAARHELAGPKRLADEAAFLPAALSLQETPAHPAPRRTAIAICALFVIALAWSIVGRLDIVAVAQGRIVVSERTKTIQPLEASVVKRVLVKEGEDVRAGQVLVELDPTNASADGHSVQEQLQAAQAEARRAASLQAALATGRANPGDEAQRAEWADIQAKLARYQAEQARRQAEIGTVDELIGKLQATLPIARQREQDVKELAAQGFMAGHAGQDRTRERIELERDLAAQQARRIEAQAALHESTRGREAYLAETRRSLKDREDKARLELARLTQERSKTEQRERLTRLTAPVDGRVQQLAVHTEGAVVTPAQLLMIVVPNDAEVSAEVVIDNKDIGFVRQGQHAEVKLETFPFTRYGTVPAVVSRVTADAVNDDKRGAIFPATLTLSKGVIDVDGRAIKLGPGMNLTAEIKTGKRRVIDYLLSPVEQTARESLGER
ncbi:MAG: HlyD family type I secretion periplasmic adaptor subunit [Proteobacteria bacterium]|nr:HlyD family type I secretion periplasmic adaptor subunit [Pseudomonadota bacterium]